MLDGNAKKTIIQSYYCRNMLLLSRGWNTLACRHVSPLRHIILTQSQSETAWYQSILYFSYFHRIRNKTGMYVIKHQSINQSINQSVTGIQQCQSRTKRPSVLEMLKTLCSVLFAISEEIKTNSVWLLSNTWYCENPVVNQYLYIAFHSNHDWLIDNYLTFNELYFWLPLNKYGELCMNEKI